MNLKVLLFGISTDLIGETSINMLLSPNTTVLQFKQKIQEQYPKLAGINSYAIAVNEKYATDDTLLKENDLIAIIPPVSGG